MTPTEHKCQACGACCMNNGRIPPLLLDEEAPEWLRCLVTELRRHFAFEATHGRCVFLTEDMFCAIHDLAKPEVCRDFTCQEHTV